MTTLQDLVPLRTIFKHYADVDLAAAGAHIYAVIAAEIWNDDELLSLAAERLPGQPAPNLLFAAAHYLLLGGAEHELRRYYPDLTPQPLEPAAAANQFRDFCMSHAGEVRELCRTRAVQTNVLERCGSLLPAFASAAAAHRTHDLATIEIGCSAALNLIWDRYRYDYADETWGDTASPVQLQIEVRSGMLPRLHPALQAVWRAGIDLNPVDLRDPDAMRWQRALMWPERIDRQQRLEAALPLLEAVAPRVETGDACEILPSLMADAPPDAALVVFASYALYQFPPEAKRQLLEILEEHSRSRMLSLITLDSVIGEGYGELVMTTFDRGIGRTMTLARCHPHGAWIEWLG